MHRRSLPIGIQTFREIREDFYYVDKGGFGTRLFAEGKYCFLSRPRRFSRIAVSGHPGGTLQRQSGPVPGIGGRTPLGLVTALPGDPAELAVG